jgi:hypothetical protein
MQVKHITEHGFEDELRKNISFLHGAWLVIHEATKMARPRYIYVHSECKVFHLTMDTARISFLRGRQTVFQEGQPDHLHANLRLIRLKRFLLIVL